MFTGDVSKMADLSERALRVSKPNASTEIVQHIGSLINLSTRKAKQQWYNNGGWENFMNYTDSLKSSLIDFGENKVV